MLARSIVMTVLAADAGTEPDASLDTVSRTRRCARSTQKQSVVEGEGDKAMIASAPRTAT